MWCAARSLLSTKSVATIAWRDSKSIIEGYRNVTSLQRELAWAWTHEQFNVIQLMSCVILKLTKLCHQNQGCCLGARGWGSWRDSILLNVALTPLHICKPNEFSTLLLSLPSPLFSSLSSFLPLSLSSLFANVVYKFLSQFLLGVVLVYMHEQIKNTVFFFFFPPRTHSQENNIQINSNDMPW